MYGFYYRLLLFITGAAVKEYLDFLWSSDLFCGLFKACCLDDYLEQEKRLWTSSQYCVFSYCKLCVPLLMYFLLIGCLVCVVLH